MKKPQRVIEIYLQPGEWWFGDRETRIRTVLGSCVSMVVWHPQRRIGGMCHYMLPARAQPAAGNRLDGRYADEALQLMVKEIRAACTLPQEYEAKLFGGGNMFNAAGGAGAVRKEGLVNARNIEAGRALAAKHGFRINAEHLGGCGHRQVIFDVWNGHTWLKHTPLSGELNPSVEKAD